METGNEKGLALNNLLITIAIVAVLAGIVILGRNPATEFSKTYDSQRESDIESILSAVYQFQNSAAARGALPHCLLGLPPNSTSIPTCDSDSSGIGIGNGGFEGAMELGTPADASTYDCSEALTPTLMGKLPVDPDTSNYHKESSGYFICQSALDQKVYVISVGAELPDELWGCEIPGTTSPAMCVSR